MKRVIILIIMLSFCSIKLFADDYMDTIAAKSCDCISKLDSKMDKNMLTTQLGLCMINQAQPYADQLKKDYNLDFTNLNGPDGEKLGQLIATRMTGICPQALTLFSQATNEDGKAGTVSISGIVTDFASGQFITLKVKSSDGTIYQLLWLYNFTNSDEIVNQIKKLKGSNVDVEYKEETLFDPKINDYRPYKVINSLQIKK